MPLQTVPLPLSGIIVDRSGTYRYVYKVLKTYRNEKGQPTCDKVSIGRLTDDGRLIPNAKYFELYGNIDVDISSTENIKFGSVKSIGATFLINSIFNNLGVHRIMESVFGSDRSKLILAVATYMVCCGNVIEYIDDWCDANYVAQSISPQMSSLLFSTITHDDIMNFFRNWVKINLTSSYIAYDVTSFSCYGKEVTDAEWGYNRDGEKLPQINMSCYLLHESGLPVFYVTYPGSIVDKSHLPYMMAYNDELQIKDVVFVMDRGFCTTTNIQWLNSQDYRFFAKVNCIVYMLPTFWRFTFDLCLRCLIVLPQCPYSQSA